MSATRSNGSRRRITVVGDALLDRDLHGCVTRVAPDAPVPVVADPTERRRPGGAALAAALAASDGVDVVLVTAIGGGQAASSLRRVLGDARVRVVDLPTRDEIGEKIRISAGEQVLLRVDRGGARTEPTAWTDAAQAALDRADAVLVADYGRGVAGDSAVREALARAVDRHVPLVWDPHPRGAAPVAGAWLVTPNRSESEVFCPEVADTSPAQAELARVRTRADSLRLRWDAGAVCVTLGGRGALLVGGDGSPFMVPAPALGNGPPGDTCGAGDRFASAAAVALAGGALPSDAVIAAVTSATQFVADGAAGTFDFADTTTSPVEPVGDDASQGSAPAGGQVGPDPDPVGPARGESVPGEAAARAVIARIRRQGGTVVATGGCFDLLHAGHVQMLRTARQLGDALIVCLNSDESVRRLKGPGRPVVRESDRMAVLAGLDAVDAVVVFGEPTPEVILERLRPDVWAKGADYAVADLPEAPLVASWGGQAVVLPYLSGRSTTAILQEVQREQ